MLSDKLATAYSELKDFTCDFADYEEGNLEVNYFDSLDEYVVNYGNYILVDDLTMIEANIILDSLLSAMEA